MDYEVIIVGGGVAGSSAALVLGRCRRRVLVCDDGRPRNGTARGVHAYLTRDGVSPQEFLRIARQEVLAYPTVRWCDGSVAEAERVPGGFRVALRDGQSLTGRKLLLATGLVDDLPEIDGFHRFWGHGVYICPFCDAWETRDQRMVVLGRERAVYNYALELRQWASELVVCTNGAESLSPAERAHLQRLRIPVIDTAVVALEGEGPQLERLRLADGNTLATGVVFVTVSQHQQAALAEKLGCTISNEGMAETCATTGGAGEGVWIAGNASTGLQMAIIAAAEGLKAAHSINEKLIEEDLVGT